jgi:hypothetical protein
MRGYISLARTDPDVNAKQRNQIMHMTRAQLAITLLAALSSPAWAESTIVPDPTLTPGAVRTADVGEICSTGTRQLRRWDRARDDRIMAEYGLPAGPHADFEIDHLIPLGIGGADGVRNLWPEPRRTIEPEWNAEAKDRLEWKLRDLVCSGALDVREVQRAIADDWTEAYGRFFRPPGNFFPPAVGAVTPR